MVVYLPHPVGIAWDPHFGEGNEFAAGGASFVDEVDCFLDASGEIKPAGLGGDLVIYLVRLGGEGERGERVGTAAALYLVRGMVVDGGGGSDGFGLGSG